MKTHSRRRRLKLYGVTGPFAIRRGPDLLYATLIYQSWGYPELDGTSNRIGCPDNTFVVVRTAARGPALLYINQ